MNTDDRSAGTELIYQLINNSNICTIKVSNKNETTYADINLASMSGVGTDTTINFIADYEKQDKVFVYDKNANVVEQKQPVQIALILFMVLFFLFYIINHFSPFPDLNHPIKYQQLENNQVWELIICPEQTMSIGDKRNLIQLVLTI